MTFPPSPIELPKVEKLFHDYCEFCRDNLLKFGIKGPNASMEIWKTPSWAPFTTYHFLRACPINMHPQIKVYADFDKKGRFKDFYRKMEGRDLPDNVKGIFQIDLVWRFEWDFIHPCPKGGDIFALALEHEESMRGNEIIQETYLGKQLNDLRRLSHVKAYRKILIDRPMYAKKSREYSDLADIHEEHFSKLMATFNIDPEEQWLIVIIHPDSLAEPKLVQLRGFRFDRDKKRLECFDTYQIPIKIQENWEWTVI